MPRDPQIKRIVQKQIGQNRRYNTALRRASVPFQNLPVLYRARFFALSDQVKRLLRIIPKELTSLAAARAAA